MYELDISNFINSNPRNKLIFSKNELPGIEWMDFGKRFTEKLLNFNIDNKIGLWSPSVIEQLINEQIKHSTAFGRYVAIKNIGILFEPSLNLNLKSMFENYSQNNLFIIYWEGEIVGKNIFFLTKENGIKINLDNISHLKI